MPHEVVPMMSTRAQWDELVGRIDLAQAGAPGAVVPERGELVDALGWAYTSGPFALDDTTRIEKLERWVLEERLRGIGKVIRELPRRCVPPHFMLAYDRPISISDTSELGGLPPGEWTPADYDRAIKAMQLGTAFSDEGLWRMAQCAVLKLLPGKGVAAVIRALRWEEIERNAPGLTLVMENAELQGCMREMPSVLVETWRKTGPWSTARFGRLAERPLGRGMKNGVTDEELLRALYWADSHLPNSARAGWTACVEVLPGLGTLFTEARSRFEAPTLPYGLVLVHTKFRDQLTETRKDPLAELKAAEPEASKEGDAGMAPKRYGLQLDAPSWDPAEFEVWQGQNGGKKITELDDVHLQNIVAMIARAAPMAYAQGGGVVSVPKAALKLMKTWPQLVPLMREASKRDNIKMPSGLQPFAFLLFDDAWYHPGERGDGTNGTPKVVRIDAFKTEELKTIIEDVWDAVIDPYARPGQSAERTQWGFLRKELPQLDTMIGELHARGERSGPNAAAERLRVARVLFEQTATDEPIATRDPAVVTTSKAPNPKEKKKMARKKKFDSEGNEVEVGMLDPLIEAGKTGLKQAGAMIAQDAMIEIGEAAVVKFFGIPLEGIDKWKREHPVAWEIALAGSAGLGAVAAGAAPEFVPGAEFIEAASLHAFAGRTQVIGYKHGTELKEFAKFMLPQLNTLRGAGAQILGKELPEEFRVASEAARDKSPVHAVADADEVAPAEKRRA